jgi:hypothetical protein
VNDDSAIAVIQLNERNVKRSLPGLETRHRLNNLSYAHRTNNPHRFSALHKRHCRKQPGQSKDVIAMEMSQEDRLDSGEPYSTLEQPRLRSFATVKQQGLFGPHNRHGRKAATLGRDGGACAKRNDFCRSHVSDDRFDFVFEKLLSV